MVWRGTAGHGMAGRGGAWCGMVRAFRLEKQGLSHATADGLGGRVKEETTARCGVVWSDEEVMIIRPSIHSSIFSCIHSFAYTLVYIPSFVRLFVRSFVRSFVYSSQLFINSFVHCFIHCFIHLIYSFLRPGL